MFSPKSRVKVGGIHGPFIILRDVFPIPPNFNIKGIESHYYFFFKISSAPHELRRGEGLSYIIPAQKCQSSQVTVKSLTHLGIWVSLQSSINFLYILQHVTLKNLYYIKLKL